MTSRVLALTGYVPAPQGAGSSAAGEATGAPGSAVPASPAGLTCGPDCPDPDACLADHWRLMERLNTYVH